MTCHPARRNSRFTTRSRAIFEAIFRAQNSFPSVFLVSLGYWLLASGYWLLASSNSSLATSPAKNASDTHARNNHPQKRPRVPVEK
jgi:hypothetical protein